MKIFRIEDFKGGWFIGNFLPSIIKTPIFEVGYHKYKKGQEWDHHVHKRMDEITLLLKGEVKIQGKRLVQGDVFLIEKYEVSDPEFLEDCEMIIIKTPSIPGDKYIVDKNQKL